MHNNHRPHWPSYTTLFLLAATCLWYSCKPAGVSHYGISNGDSTATPTDTVNPAATTTPYIAVPNNDEKTLDIYNVNSTSWNDDTREWRWQPTPALGYSDDAIAAMGAGIGDMRMHQINGFDQVNTAFVIQGGRWLGIGVYDGRGTKGQMLWEHTFPQDQDPNNHAVELLPNGNIAVAGYGDASANSRYGNWIRIYNTADPSGASFAEIKLIGPHALLMDTVYNRLWAGGVVLIDGLAYHGIFAYTLGGTREHPTITEDVSLRTVLRYGNPTIPTAAPDYLKWPHDLAADYDNDDILYYGDHTGVYVFDKKALTLMPTPDASHRYSGKEIRLKSVGKLAGAHHLSTEAYSTQNEYMTDRVDFFDPVSGKLSFSRSVGSFTIYRARVWTAPYQ